jgi:hypothetical protein
MFGRGDEVIDTIQTIGIVANTAVLIYIVWRFDQAIRGASKGMSAAIGQTEEFRLEFRQELERTWRRIEKLEDDLAKLAQQSDRAKLGEWVGEAWQHIVKLEARQDAAEKGEPPPPSTRPTDPPLGSGGTPQ